MHRLIKQRRIRWVKEFDEDLKIDLACFLDTHQDGNPPRGSGNTNVYADKVDGRVIATYGFRNKRESRRQRTKRLMREVYGA